MKARFESRLSLMNRQISVTVFGSGARDGGAMRGVFSGTTSFGVVCRPARSSGSGMGAGIDLGADERQMLAHGVGAGIP